MAGRGGAVGDGRACYLGEFRFDLARCRLERAGGEVMLRPKAAAVLAALAGRAGEVVPKADLVRAVWPEGFVGDGALAVCITELRQAFGDDAHEPRFIATVHRSGYRLLVEPATAAPPPSADRVFVGRAAALAALDGWWEQARAGRRCVGFVTAPAGVGKTALLDEFTATVRGRPATLVGLGQCVERIGAGEPYLPVLAALSGLCRGPGGAAVVDVLRRCAPAWLSQLPGLPGEAKPVLARRLSATRMLREFAAAVTVLAERRDVLLVFEDLHDADPGTVGLISYLARGREPARLLLVGSYRPAEVITRGHPLHATVQDLALRGLCEVLPLEVLSADEVAGYLRTALAPRVPAPELVAEVHARTDGNALFVAALCRHLGDSGLLVDDGDGVRAAGPLAGLGVPDEVRLMLARQLDALDAADRRLLSVAAVAGVEFTVEAVAGALPAVEVEERCARLARAAGLLRDTGSVEWPDGTLTARYRFGHEMYREVLYADLGPARRVAAHRAIGARLAAGYVPRTAEIAVELAAHFEQGRDFPAAIGHRVGAARVALARSGYPAAQEHVRRGLALLDRLPDDGTRAGLELGLRHIQVLAAAAVWDWQEPDAETACRRLRELATERGDTVVLVAALLGEHNVAMTRGDAVGRAACARQLLELAARTGDPAAQLIAQLLQVHLASRAGACTEMWAHAEQMLTLYRPDEHDELALLVGEEPNIAGHELGAVALWQLGHPDQARRHAAAAVAAARVLDIPADLARALWFAGIVHLLCGDAARVAELTAELDGIAARHELALWRAGGAVLAGWAAATRGDVDSGLAQLREGMAGWARFARIGATLHAAIAADVYLTASRPADALAAARTGLAAVDTDGERQSEPELLRLHGEALLRTGDPDRGELQLARALDLADQRQARGWQLRTATSLARLRAYRGDTGAAAARLTPVYRTFTEGRDTRDLRVAAALLADLRAAKSE